MDRRRGGLRCDVLSCAVLSCAVNTNFLYLLFEAWDLPQCFLAACSCFKHFINRYKYINIYIDVYTCMYKNMCVCVSVCVCDCLCVSLRVCLCVVCVCDRVGVLCVLKGEEGGCGGGGDGGWVVVVLVVPSAVSLRTAETEQLYQGKRIIGNRARVVLDLFSNLKCSK